MISEGKGGTDGACSHPAVQAKVVLAGSLACGGGGGGGSTNPVQTTAGTTSGSYTFTVTGADSSKPAIIASTTVKVTVL